MYRWHKESPLSTQLVSSQRYFACSVTSHFASQTTLAPDAGVIVLAHDPLAPLRDGLAGDLSRPLLASPPLMRELTLRLACR